VRLGVEFEIDLKPEVDACDLKKDFFSVLHVLADNACFWQVSHSLALFTDVMRSQAIKGFKELEIVLHKFSNQELQVSNRFLRLNF